MYRKTVIGCVAILDVAMLVATSQSVTPLSGEADLGAVALSADAPDLAIDPIVTIGDLLEGNAFTVSVELSVENAGGEGWLLLYVLPEAWDGGEVPSSPMATYAVADGLDTPFAMDAVLSIPVEGAELADLHLLLRADGDVDIEGTGTLVVSTEISGVPEEDRAQISVEIP